MLIFGAKTTINNSDQDDPVPDFIKFESIETSDCLCQNQPGSTKKPSCGDSIPCLKEVDEEGNPIFKELLEQGCSIPPKTVFSRKFVENPINCIKSFHQNKRVVLYKTEMCRSYSELGFCKYGNRCQFCHVPSELRAVKRHPRYKTEICKTFWNEGSCPYGSRCCFIHLEDGMLSSSKTLENIKEEEGIIEDYRENNCDEASLMKKDTVERLESTKNINSSKEKTGLEAKGLCPGETDEIAINPIDTVKEGKIEKETFKLFFNNNLNRVKDARLLEIEQEPIQYKKNGEWEDVFSSTRSIEDMRIERECVWNRNYIRRWIKEPVFFIFESNKYDKL
ncbi:hypothetical protein GINT2_002300 [Glugoides intestinalis]